MLMYRTELAQTLQISVLRPVPKATVHNECGLPMCAVDGLEPELANTRKKNETNALYHSATVSPHMWLALLTIYYKTAMHLEL